VPASLVSVIAEQIRAIFTSEDFAVQPNRTSQPIFLERRRLLGALGLAGLGLFSGPVIEQTAPVARADQDKKSRPKFNVSPPPDDLNDLSMEVAALRTMYLLKASPDQAPDLPDRNQFNGIAHLAKNPKPTAEPPRDRNEAKASKNFRKVLADLRAAFIVNHERRIRELSDQLEEVTKDEQPELDDGIEITEAARNNVHRLLLYFDANRTVPYLAAYGKEFPDPFMLILRSIGADPKSSKPSVDDWPQVREFVIKEVSWQVGGLNPKKQEQIRAQVAEFLDMAGKLSDAELKKGGRPGGKLKGPIGKIVNVADCTDIIRNVLQQDLAELLSNPRLLPAWNARRDYLGVAGHWSDDPVETRRVWSPN
jgi:hypothetical protein